MISSRLKVVIPFLLLFLFMLYACRSFLGHGPLKLADYFQVYEMDFLREATISVPLRNRQPEAGRMAAGQSAAAVDVHFKELGPSKTENSPDLPLKTDVLLLHGKKFSSQTWLDLDTLRVLGERGHRAVAVDLPGFGRSGSAAGLDGDDDEGFQDRKSFLQSLIKTLQLRKPAVVSPSMSGAFSLPLLVDRPDLFGAYVPVAPVYTPKFPAELYMRTRVPTLIVVGDLDTNLGVISVKHLKNLPLHKLLTLPNSRHPAYLDQPDMWHKNLLEFLDNLDNPAYFAPGRA